MTAVAGLHSHRNANAMNAVKASAANAPSATQIANAPEASAAAAGNAAGNAANAAAAANGRADHKPVAAAEEAVFRDVPPAGRVVPAVSEALRVVPVDSCGCFRSWLRSTRTVTAKSPPRKSRQHPPRSRSWTKTMTVN